MDCNLDNTRTQDDDYESHYKRLLSEYDLNSATEKPFIEYLHKNGIILPDLAQVNLKDFYVSADFVYKDENTFIFCDGSVHDRPDVQQDDKMKRDALINAGYDVVVWHHSESLDDLVKEEKTSSEKLDNKFIRCLTTSY